MVSDFPQGAVVGRIPLARSGSAGQGYRDELRGSLVTRGPWYDRLISERRQPVPRFDPLMGGTGAF